MGIFSKDKDKKNTSPAVQQPAPVTSVETENTLNQLHQTRQNMNRIIDTIDSINFAEIERKASILRASITEYVKAEDALPGDPEYVEVERTGVEVLNDMRSTLNLLKKKMNAEDAASLLEAETSVIDARLLKFAETMKKSLESPNADLDTAKACLSGLIYGVMVGHSSISSDPDERENEISVRERKIGDYDEIIKVSKKIMGLRNSRNNLLKQNNESIKPRYYKAREEYEEDRNNHSSIYEEIEGLNSEQVDKLGSEHIKAWARGANMMNLCKLHERLKDQIALIDDNMKRYELSIDNIKNALSVENMYFDEKMQREIDEKISHVPDRILQVINSTNSVQQSLDKLDNAFTAILNGYDMKVNITKVMDGVKNINREIEKQEERDKDDAATRKAQLELEEERMRIEAEKEAERAKQKLEEAQAKLEKKESKQKTQKAMSTKKRNRNNKIIK